MRRLAPAAAAIVLLGGGPASAAYPGSNGRIAFAKRGDIVTVRPDGAHQRRLTSRRGYESGPVWSPAGTRMLFARGGDTYDHELWVMNRQGENKRSVVDFRGGLSGMSWKPDGSKIVYSVNRRHSRGDLYVADLRGERMRRLTRGSTDDALPVWSPDGDRVAFVSDRKGPSFDIWTVRLDGSHLRRLTRGITVCRGGCEDRYGGVTSLDYSPDGDSLLYVAHRGDGSSVMHVVDEDGHRARRLGDAYIAAWAPSGRRILLVRHGRLLTTQLDGSRRQTVAKGNVYYASWGSNTLRGRDRRPGGKIDASSRPDCHRPERDERVRT